MVTVTSHSNVRILQDNESYSIGLNIEYTHKHQILEVIATVPVM